jgi:hypothetical protein
MENPKYGINLSNTIKDIKKIDSEIAELILPGT